jgi:hypothetical protein
MERVALVVEATGERLSCLLNPEQLVLRRRAGVHARGAAAGGLGGLESRDDPLVYGGGGHTELELDLLFDTELDTGRPPVSATAPDLTDGANEDAAFAPSAPRWRDVRELTAPLWELAETPRELPAGNRFHARLVRFVWGKAWNVPGVVTAVAERLERFGPEGQPTRSWLRLRIVRVDEPALSDAAVGEASPLPPPDELTWPTPDTPLPPDEVELRLPLGEPLGDGADERMLVRPDLWSQEMYGTPFLWRLFAYGSGLDDPLFPDPDSPVRFPPRSALGSRPRGAAAAEGSSNGGSGNGGGNR